MQNFLDTPITEEELKEAVSKGICNKAPEFFKVEGDMLAIFNRIFLDVRIIEQQKHGIVVCITKNDISTTPAEYRQITLLNTEYKIPARIRTTD